MTRRKIKRPKWMRGLTNGALNTLWSRVVKKRWNGWCAICGADDQALQAHHIVHCNRLVLRFDPENGVAVCSIGSCPESRHGETCHEFADSEEGKRYLEALLGKERWAYLQEKQHVLKPEELLAAGLSEREWRTRWRAALMAELREE